jgi:hypothetical protein
MKQFSIFVAFFVASVLVTAQSAFAVADNPCTAAEVARGKSTICHVPPGHPANAMTLCVGNSAVPAHLSNHPGDHLGACEESSCPNPNGVCEPDLGENCVNCPEDCNGGTVCCTLNEFHCSAAACCEACPEGTTCSETTVCTGHAAPACGGSLSCSTCDAPE